MGEVLVFQKEEKKAVAEKFKKIREKKVKEPEFELRVTGLAPNTTS